jgi:hypothetical protein
VHFFATAAAGLEASMRVMEEPSVSDFHYCLRLMPSCERFKNPCWNTADDGKAKFQDGGLPCVPCPIDIESREKHKNVTTSIGNEFCAIDAYEDTFSINDAIRLMRAAASKPFYLAVGLHKPHMPWQYAQEDLVRATRCEVCAGVWFVHRAAVARTFV